MLFFLQSNSNINPKAHCDLNICTVTEVVIIIHFLCLFLQEFEVIAQIKLLQSACNSYCLNPDSAFLLWFKNQPQHTEEER